MASVAASNTSINPVPSMGGSLRGTISSGNLSSDDAIWVLTSTFIIFTMQSGKTCIRYIGKQRPPRPYMYLQKIFEIDREF
jgi:hypothetical protein